MDRSEYIAALTASPSRFPEVDGADDVPSDWAADAWEVEAIRAPIVNDLLRGVSKVGKLWRDEKQLMKMSEVLRTDQVVALYEALSNDSPHREVEFPWRFSEDFRKARTPTPTGADA